MSVGASQSKALEVSVPVSHATFSYSRQSSAFPYIP